LFRHQEPNLCQNKPTTARCAVPVHIVNNDSANELHPEAHQEHEAIQEPKCLMIGSRERITVTRIFLVSLMCFGVQFIDLYYCYDVPLPLPHQAQAHLKHARKVGLRGDLAKAGTAKCGVRGTKDGRIECVDRF
jgi:hypothetical protein